MKKLMGHFLTYQFTFGLFGRANDVGPVASNATRRWKQGGLMCFSWTSNAVNNDASTECKSADT